MWDSSLPRQVSRHPPQADSGQAHAHDSGAQGTPVPARDTLHIAIADADALARQRLRRLIEPERDLHLSGECRTAEAALPLLDKEELDVLVIDWSLPDLEHVLMPRLRALATEGRAPLLVAVGEAHHAASALDAGAVDFVSRPVSVERLLRAFDRLRERRRMQSLEAEHERLLQAFATLAERRNDSDEDSAASDKWIQRFLVKHDGRMYFVRPDDVDWIEAFGNYVRLHQGGGRPTHVIRMTMTAVERRLPPDRFVRIHRSVIVNLDRVREMQPWFSGDYLVYLMDGTQLKLSRVYRDRLEERLRM
jgi:two-component system, LytTR family, response regulator